MDATLHKKTPDRKHFASCLEQHLFSQLSLTLQVNLNFKLLKERGPVKELVPKGINVVSVLPNGEVLAGGDNGDIIVVRGGVSQLPKACSGKVQGGISTLAIDMSSYDGTSLGFYVGTVTSNIYYALYNTKAGTLQTELLQTAHSRKINDIAFPYMYSAVFATASRGEIRVWNIQTCRELLRIVVPNLECHCVCFQANGKAILSGWSDGKIRAFGPQSGKVMFVINDAHHKAVTSIACSEDCGLIVSGGEEGMVRLWHLGYDSQSMTASMKDHNNTVNAIQILGNNDVRAQTVVDNRHSQSCGKRQADWEVCASVGRFCVLGRFLHCLGYLRPQSPQAAHQLLCQHIFQWRHLPP